MRLKFDTTGTFFPVYYQSFAIHIVFLHKNTNRIKQYYWNGYICLMYLRSVAVSMAREI